MGALTFDALLRSLKQRGPGGGGGGGGGGKGGSGGSGGRKKLEPVYYLHGDEDVLKDEAIRALVDRAVDRGTRDFNFDQRSVADLDPEAFHTLVNTPPMLAAARAVVLRGLEALKKTSKVRQELVRYLDSPNPTTLLVLVHGAGDPPDPELARAATTVAVEPLPPARVQSWVAHRAGLLKLELEPEAAELLVAAVGNDLGALAGELEKLAAVAAGSGRAATRDDVTALVGVRRGETLNDLVDAALERRGADAARLVGPVLEQGGMSGVRALTALGTALVGTALARAELDGGATRGRLESIILAHLRATRPYGIGRWEDTAARWARWAGLWRARELRQAQRLALEADRALKSTTVTDERGILMQLVLSWAVSTREAA
jgi:DNA polymerase III subunit delta